MGRLLGLLALLVLAGGAAWLLLEDGAAPDIQPTDDDATGATEDLPPTLMGVKKGVQTLPPRDVRITVVEGAQRTPVVGALVAVSGFLVDAPDPTDEEGRTWIRRVPAGQGLRVDVRRARSLMRPQSARLSGSAKGYTIELAPARTVTWRIAGDAPPDGTTIRVARSADPDAEGVTVSIRDGALEVGGWGSGPVRAWAYASDGRAAELRAGRSDEGESIVFQVARTLRVDLTFDDGSAAGGLLVEVVRDGDVPALRQASTDDDGAVRFAGLPAASFRLRAFDRKGGPVPTVGGRDRFEFGWVDLHKEDGAIEATLMRPHVYEIHVSGLRDPGALALTTVTIDGKPVGTERVSPDGPLRATWYRLLPRDPRTVAVRVPGYLGALAPVPQSRIDGPTRVDVALQPAAAVRLRVAGRVGAASRDLLVHLERYDEERQHWVYAERTIPSQNPFRAQRTQRQDGSFEIDDIPPGRYRFIDPSTLLTSTVVDAATEMTPTAALDLTRVRRVRGRVKVPDKASPMEVGIAVRAREDRSHVEAGVSFGPETWVGPDGAFQFDVPLDRVVEVRAVHPTWRAKRSPVLVDEDTKEVVLELEKRPVRKIRLKGDYGRLDRARGVLRTMPVYISRTRDDGEVQTVREAVRIIGHAATFVPPDWSEPCRVFFDTKPFAPLVFENVLLQFGHGVRRPQGSRFLPHTPQALVAGGRIRFDVRASGGLKFRAKATHLGDVSYEREGKGPGSMTLSGLGKGRFRVALWFLHDPGPPVWEGELESDGKGEIVVPVDLLD